MASKISFQMAGELQTLGMLGDPPLEGIHVGSDPLAELAAALGTQEDTNKNENGPLLESNNSEKNGDPETAVSSIIACNSLQLAYNAACSARREQPNSEHLEILSKIPLSLFVHMGANQRPSAVAGGAKITVPASCGATEGQLDALLNGVVLPGTVKNRMLLLDHLSVSGLRDMSRTDILERFVNGTARLGSWWRLRSLDLRGCGLQLKHILHLCGLNTVTFAWNLEQLDLSDNPDIGMAPENSLPRPASAFAHPDLVYFLPLWINAPLRYINLTHTGKY